MKAKLMRIVAVGALAAAGWGVSAAMSPAQASHDLCHNEPADWNSPQVNTTNVGIDDGSTGLTGVAVVCVRNGTTGTVAAGGGVHQRSGGYDVYYCLNTCELAPIIIRP